METSMPKSCLGSLYLANAEEIQMTCRFKVAEASEKIFELAENTWACLHNRNDQYQPGLSGKEHDPDLSN